MLESLFNNVADLKASNFVEKRLQPGCFPVKLGKLLRAPILKNICEQQLLYCIDFTFIKLVNLKKIFHDFIKGSHLRIIAHAGNFFERFHMRQ